LVQTQNSIETNIDGENGDEFIFVGDDEKDKVLEIDLAEFFRLIGGEHLLTMHEKLSDKDNLTNSYQSETIEAETLAKTLNIELKPLSSSFHYEFLGLNETYLVFVNLNLELAQIESVLVFSLKIDTSDHVS
jgi:hypothetical protein